MQCTESRICYLCLRKWHSGLYRGHFPNVMIYVRMLGILLEFYPDIVVLNGTDSRQICRDYKILIEISK